VISLLVAATGGVLTAQGARHGHGVKVIYESNGKFLAGNDVNFVIARCPRGTRVTGFGANTTGAGAGVVLQQDIFGPENAGGAIFQNISDTGATMHGHVACMKNRTSKVRAKVSADDSSAALDALRAKADQLEAELGP
jgi:hypothetical protein